MFARIERANDTVSGWFNPRLIDPDGAYALFLHETHLDDQLARSVVRVCAHAGAKYFILCFLNKGRIEVCKRVPLIYQRLLHELNALPYLACLVLAENAELCLYVSVDTFGLVAGALSVVEDVLLGHSIEAVNADFVKKVNELNASLLKDQLLDVLAYYSIVSEQPKGSGLEWP